MTKKILTYDNLKLGHFYTSSYPRQGKYIFKHGYNLWMSCDIGKVMTSNGAFNPGNGFHEFEKATKKEIALLMEGAPSLIMEKANLPIQNNIESAKTYLSKQGCNLHSYIINYDTIARYLVCYAKQFENK